MIDLIGTFPIAIAIAFLMGFGARQIGLPPLIGFLVAGFFLSAMGAKGDATIQEIADLGVTLLLFTIGLKLKIKSLLRKEVWAGATLHAAITVAVLGVCFYGVSLAGLVLFAELDWSTSFLIAFALSFSSTVFAVKALEEKGEMNSLHGRTAIGILIMQDIFAVIFITASSGKLPSPWAFALFGLILLRPILGKMLDRCGHGELLPLFGMFAAIGIGVALFTLVGLKADLGALILGMLLAGHPKASEIADTLFGFKEILLVGFFLNIGLSGVPGFKELGLAVLLILLVPLKTGLFFILLTRFSLRARSSMLASLCLANYSEFGLIVGSIGVKEGWISAQWLMVIAIALSISFIMAAPLNTASQTLIARWREFLRRFEREQRHPEEEFVDPGNAEIAVVGMGRIGMGAYDAMRERHGDVVIGLEVSAEKVAEHVAAGRNVIEGDLCDPEFWERIQREEIAIRVCLLAMPEHHANITVLNELKKRKFTGYIAALVQFPDEAKEIEALGAHIAFDVHAEAGSGFAIHVEDKIKQLEKL